MAGKVLLLLSAVWLGGCHRGIKSSSGEREVDTGISVAFGASGSTTDSTRWDFGDGSPPREGRSASHAFRRAGEYRVRATDEGREVGQVSIRVRPRPAVRAIPGAARVALFVPRLEGNLNQCIDFLERVLGSRAAQALIENSPLLKLAFEGVSGLSGSSPVVDPLEGVGLFGTARFAGVVGFLGVVDEEAAVAALVRTLEENGGTGLGDARGVTVVNMPEGKRLGVFTDRGYLFLAASEDGEEGVAPFVPVLEAVRGSPDEGLEGALEGEPLGGGGRPAQLQAYVDLSPNARQIQRVRLSFAVVEEGVEFDGLVSSIEGLGSEAAVAPSRLLERLPAGPIFAVSNGISVERLVRWGVGGPGGDGRKALAARVRLNEADLEWLLDSLRGDFAAAAYFDARAFLDGLVAGGGDPVLRLNLVAEAGLVRDDRVVEIVTSWLGGQGAPATVERIAPARTQITTRLGNAPVRFEISPDTLRVESGDLPGPKPDGGSGADLVRRYADGAFTPGHLSAVLDMGQVGRDLAEVPGTAGEPSARMELVRGLADTFWKQVSPVETTFVDLFLESGRGHVRGKIALRR